ncbi:MAG: aminotransferase class V-fold PLP-dependent enzyme [Deltaproteobacteria bacterium]|nr:aminotransferase class V-fold PLP-dependent enzyme [Deltaproteobacteria bacterium]
MSTQFDKSEASFPYKSSGAVALDTCFRSAMRASTVEAVRNAMQAEAELGSEIGSHSEYGNLAIQGGLRRAVSRLLKVPQNEISLHGNTDAAMKVIASRFPFEPTSSTVVALRGDYPSVYDSFAQRRGVNLAFIEGRLDDNHRPISWDVNELDRILALTRAPLVAISHVMYRSGFRADLERVQDVCRSHGAYLVIDAAQSIGVYPLHPLEIGIDAVAFPFWKGCEAPRGTAALWTSPVFSELLDSTDYRCHEVKELISSTGMTSIDRPDAVRFEPTTLPTPLLAGTLEALNQGVLRYPHGELYSEVMRLQRLFAEKLDTDYAKPVLQDDLRGGLILALYLPRHEGKEGFVVKAAREEGIRITNRDGMVRISPHYHCTDAEIVEAAERLNTILKS